VNPNKLGGHCYTISVIIDKLGIVAQKLIGLECKIFEDTNKESMLIINQGAGSIHTLTA